MSCHLVVTGVKLMRSFLFLFWDDYLDQKNSSGCVFVFYSFKANLIRQYHLANSIEFLILICATLWPVFFESSQWRSVVCCLPRRGQETDVIRFATLQIQKCSSGNSLPGGAGERPMDPLVSRDSQSLAFSIQIADFTINFTKS